MRRLVLIVTLLAAVAVAVPASAQTEPARLAVTATSDRCADGRPVVDYTVTNQWSTAASVEAWWVADASVYGVAGSHSLGPAPDGTTGSFTLPFGFYTTVTVYATVAWPDGAVTTNASWAIPVADCAAPTPPPTTAPAGSTTTTTIAVTTTTVDDGNGNGNGNGNGHGRPTTTVQAG
jgi:hypothetical protein